LLLQSAAPRFQTLSLNPAAPACAGSIATAKATIHFIARPLDYDAVSGKYGSRPQ
jgi:hypothetical protein